MDALFSIPVLSLFLVPALSSYTTSLNLIFFYMTWTTLVLSHPPLRVELFGTAAVRILFFALPSLLFFLFDILTPSTAVVVKAQGENGLPGGKRRRNIRLKELKVAGWALFNLGLGVAAQAAIESLLVRGFGVRSALKVSMRLPLPWEMVKDMIRGLLGREVSLVPDQCQVGGQWLTYNAFSDPHLHLASLCPPLEILVPRKIPPKLVPRSPRPLPTDSALRPSTRIHRLQIHPDLRASHALPLPHAHLPALPINHLN